MSAFEVTSLDFTGVNTTEEVSRKVLRKPGEYPFTILDNPTLSTEWKNGDPRVDKAGKRWASMMLKCETVINDRPYYFSTFMEIPMETALYTTRAASGDQPAKTTPIHIIRLKGLLRSQGRSVENADLENDIKNIESIITSGMTFVGKVDYTSDHLKAVRENDVTVFKIALRNGGFQLDNLGQELVFETADAAKMHYKNEKGYALRDNLSLVKISTVAN